jgi:hypothetical protein
MTKKVYLGGTLSGSTWRDDLIKLLKIDYFKPTNEAWTAEGHNEEQSQRFICDYFLYVITPKMIDIHTIVCVTEDSSMIPDKTIFCVLNSDNGLTFDQEQLKSLEDLSKSVSSNGANVFYDLKSVAEFLNKQG